MHELLATVSIMNAERFVGDSKIHEMVAIAMEESWDVCDAHIKRIMMAIAAVIADGAKSGAFNVKDVERLPSAFAPECCGSSHRR